MVFFFVKDYQQKHRFFSSEPPKEIPVKFSRPRKIWEQAKKKLLLLPPRILRQEEAFIRASKIEGRTEVIHSGSLSDRRTRRKFYFFLQRQRTRHISLLIGESLLLPISGLAALLPGPNVFFGALALFMITHWQALKGINRLIRKKQDLAISPLVAEWEKAVDSKTEDGFPEILRKIEEEYALESLSKILWH